MPKTLCNEDFEAIGHKLQLIEEAVAEICRDPLDFKARHSVKQGLEELAAIFKEASGPSSATSIQAVIPFGPNELAAALGLVRPSFS
jgi:hypothetical protein